jgi:hypothetical protein
MKEVTAEEARLILKQVRQERQKALQAAFQKFLKDNNCSIQVQHTIVIVERETP